jgi:hypothetical protein
MCLTQVSASSRVSAWARARANQGSA